MQIELQLVNAVTASELLQLLKKKNAGFLVILDVSEQELDLIEVCLQGVVGDLLPQGVSGFLFNEHQPFVNSGVDHRCIVCGQQPLDLVLPQQFH